jgi:hypothetical protein
MKIKLTLTRQVQRHVFVPRGVNAVVRKQQRQDPHTPEATRMAHSLPVIRGRVRGQIARLRLAQQLCTCTVRTGEQVLATGIAAATSAAARY